MLSVTNELIVLSSIMLNVFYVECHKEVYNSEFHYGECLILGVIMPSVIMQMSFMLSVIMLNVFYAECHYAEYH
jgi:hypothetical protein